MRTVAWSPDGTRIAWQSDGANLWIARADGSHAVVRSRHVAYTSELAWLPGGSFLWTGEDGVAMLPAAAARPRALGDSIDQFSADRAGTLVAWGAPSCSLCHGPIVVESLRDGSRKRIGGEYTQNSLPALSPDGRDVVFTRWFCVHPNEACGRFGGLWLSSSDGRGLHRLAADGDCAQWAPDGKSILFGARRGLSLMRPDGTFLGTVGPETGCDVGPPDVAWAPSSSSVAYWGPGGLEVVDVASKRVRKLTGSRVGEILDVAWSPDATRLLVAASARGDSCASLWLVRADGSGTSLLRRC